MQDGNADINQPNELDSRKISNPSTRLPEATKGQIQNILQDNPEEAVRRINHKQALQGNTHNLKTGTYSKLLPQYLLNHLDYQATQNKLEASSSCGVREAEGQSLCDNELCTREKRNCRMKVITEFIIQLGRG